MYLQQRYRTWWALHDVPTAAQSVLGKRLARSLKTSDRKQAERLASLLWLHDWSLRIRRAVEAHSGGDDAEAAMFRSLLLNASTETERELLRDHIASVAGDRYDRATTTVEVSAALRFHRSASGQLTPLLDHLDGWLAADSVSAKTKAMARSAVLVLARSCPYVEEVDAKAAQAWITNRATVENLSAKTLRRILGHLRSYWRYLASLSITSTDPFKGLTLPPSSRRPRRTRLPFTAAQVLELLDAATEAKDEELADVVQLGMYTGCRIEEVCSLKVSEVNLRDLWFTIADAKTAAGVRQVPIHSALASTFHRLVAGRTTGYVMANLTANKYGDRAPGIGKRFGRLRTRLGHPSTLVYHSIRKTVATLLENAGVPEGVAADLLGHEKQTLTYGLYSGGASLEVKRTAIERVEYRRSA